jgi:D-xylose transport system substrate-binding protein
MFEKVPTGNYVLIKGHQGDPNASVFLPLGWDNAGLADKIASGDINVVYESYTDGWKPDVATDNMDAAIQAASDAGTDIDDVLAENDSTAFGVIASLVTNGIAGIPVSGQDGDPANLNYVAQGLQYVDVWKDSNLLGKVGAEAALQLCAGVPIGEVTISDSLWAELEAAGVAPEAGATAADFTTPGLDKLPDTGDENVVKALILKPTPITADNLQKVLDGGWITPEDLCKGVTAEMPGAAVCGVS